MSFYEMYVRHKNPTQKIDVKNNLKDHSALEGAQIACQRCKEGRGYNKWHIFCYENRAFAIASVLRDDTFLCRTDIEDFIHFEEILQILPFLFVISIFIELKEYLKNVVNTNIE